MHLAKILMGIKKIMYYCIFHKMASITKDKSKIIKEMDLEDNCGMMGPIMKYYY